MLGRVGPGLTHKVQIQAIVRAPFPVAWLSPAVQGTARACSTLLSFGSLNFILCGQHTLLFPCSQHCFQVAQH